MLDGNYCWCNVLYRYYIQCRETHWFSVAPDDSVLVHFAVHDIASYNYCNNHKVAVLRYYTLLTNIANSLITEVATIAITIKVNSGGVPVWE